MRKTEPREAERKPNRCTWRRYRRDQGLKTGSEATTLTLSVGGIAPTSYPTRSPLASNIAPHGRLQVSTPRAAAYSRTDVLRTYRQPPARDSTGAQSCSYQSPRASRTQGSSASTADGTVIWLMARSGSFSPWPGQDADHRRPSGTPYFMRPATDAADAASQNTDSSEARKR